MSKPRVVAIIQARMGSTRLPGKTLADICGKPLLQHLIERVKRAETLDEIVVATSDKRRDRPIIELANKCGVSSFAGSEEDVLDRFMKAAEKFRADVIVRICADNPLTDPCEIDKLFCFHLETGADYSYNNQPHPKGLPDGVGAEALNMETLRKVHKLATEQQRREHVTSSILENPGMFHIERLDADPSLRRPEIKVDVDTIEDLQFVRKVFQQLGQYGEITEVRTRDIIEVVDALHSSTDCGSRSIT